MEVLTHVAEGLVVTEVFQEHHLNLWLAGRVQPVCICIQPAGLVRMNMCSSSQIDASWLPPMRILPEQLHEVRVEGSCYVVLEVTGVLGSNTCTLSPVWDAQWQCHATACQPQ